MASPRSFGIYSVKVNIHAFSKIGNKTGTWEQNGTETGTQSRVKCFSDASVEFWRSQKGARGVLRLFRVGLGTLLDRLGTFGYGVKSGRCGH